MQTIKFLSLPQRKLTLAGSKSKESKTQNLSHPFPMIIIGHSHSKQFSSLRYSKPPHWVGCLMHEPLASFPPPTVSLKISSNQSEMFGVILRTGAQIVKRIEEHQL